MDAMQMDGEGEIIVNCEGNENELSY